MQKKYCIFSAQYLPHMGGIENYTYNIAKELVKTGNRVTIVTNNTTNSPALQESEKIKVMRFSCYPLIDGRFPIPKFNKTFRSINNILKQESFDIVIINARFYIHSIYAARFAMKSNIPCICIDHGTSHLSVHNPFLNTLGNMYEHLHTMVLKHYCNNYYGVSKACCQWLTHFGIKARGVFYNAVNLEEIEQLKSQCVRDFRSEYGIGDNEIVITFTGRLLKEKGIYQLINAVERYNKKFTKIHLMIAGEGVEWEYVKNHSSEYIHPLKRIKFEEIISLLNQSDIFCLPSVSEGFSTSALEAAACKCYIITTKTGGTKELVTGKRYGIIMENNSVDSIYNAFLECVENSKMRKEGCELCYQRLIDNYTWTRTAMTINTLCKTWSSR